MFRALTAFGAVALFASAATAQPGRLPLSPGVMPGSPYAPGTQFVSPGTTPNMAGLQILPIMAPWGYPVTPVYGTAFGGFGGFGGGYGYGYPYGGVNVLPPINITQSAVVIAPRFAPTSVVLTKEFPATLTLQFPTAAEVWVDGKKADGIATNERVLTSPVLKPGEQHTFAVKARWTSGGKTYEATRSVTLSAGDRSRLFIISGTEVAG